MGSSSFHSAVGSGDSNTIRAMLADGADVNAANETGQTPIILAITTGQYHLVALLIRARANPFLRDKTGLNAIDWAERKGRADLGQFMAKESRSDFLTTSIESPGPEHRALQQTEPEAQSAPPLSPDEKARKFVAGLKQRFEEQARRSTTNQAAQSSSPDPIKNKSTSSSPLPIPEIGARDESLRKSSPTDEEPKRPSSSRKRCPECGAIYDSELLGYCAYHVVALVDADSPIAPTPKTLSSPVPVLWIMVAVALAAGAFAGLLLTRQIFSPKGPDPFSATVSEPAPAQKGIPTLGKQLDGTAVSLPEAEVPANTAKEPTQINVRVKIDREGRVSTASSTAVDAVLRDAAIAAAKKSTFSAQKLRRRMTEGTISYTFK